MRVKVIRASDDYLLNVRYTDELLENGTLKDEAELILAEEQLKAAGRYWLDADTFLQPKIRSRSNDV